MPGSAGYEVKRVFSIGLSISLSAIAPVALACSCPGLPQTADDAETWVARSDLVALVRIEEQLSRAWVENDARRFDSLVRATIVRQFKVPPENSEVYSDLSSESSCLAHFQLQYNYLVFADGPGPDGRFRTSLCTTGRFTTEVEGEQRNNKHLREIITATINSITEALEKGIVIDR